MMEGYENAVKTKLKKDLILKRLRELRKTAEERI